MQQHTLIAADWKFVRRIAEKEFREVKLLLIDVLAQVLGEAQTSRRHLQRALQFVLYNPKASSN